MHRKGIITKEVCVKQTKLYTYAARIPGTGLYMVKSCCDRVTHRWCLLPGVGRRVTPLGPSPCPGTVHFVPVAQRGLARAVTCSRLT